MAGRTAPTSTKPVHAFKPTSGSMIGYLAVAAALVVVVLAAATEHSLFGLRAGLVAAIVAVVAWMTLLRPRVAAYVDTLLLRNMASDTYLPLASVENVLVRHQLNVWLGDQRFTCAGIGRSSRSMLRAERRGPDDSAGSDYVTFVETSIDDLARAARRDLRGDPPPIRTRPAIPELAALTVLVLAFLLSFAL
jgi:hypothetical protein